VEAARCRLIRKGTIGLTCPGATFTRSARLQEVYLRDGLIEPLKGGGIYDGGMFQQTKHTGTVGQETRWRGVG